MVREKKSVSKICITFPLVNVGIRSYLRKITFPKDLNNDELREIVETNKYIILTKYRENQSRENSPMSIL